MFLYRKKRQWPNVDVDDGESRELAVPRNWPEVDVDDGGSHGLAVAVALETDAGAIVRDEQWVAKGSI